MTTHILDVKNMLCPMPVIRTQNFIKKLHSGEVLQVLCTDPGALHDIPAWCRIHGHKVLDINKQNKELVITIEVISHPI